VCCVVCLHVMFAGLRICGLGCFVGVLWVFYGLYFANTQQQTRKHHANTTQTPRKHHTNTMQTPRKHHANTTQIHKHHANTTQTPRKHHANTTQTPRKHHANTMQHTLCTYKCVQRGESLAPPFCLNFYTLP
jgi:hypothetical protein